MTSAWRISADNRAISDSRVPGNVAGEADVTADPLAAGKINDDQPSYAR